MREKTRTCWNVRNPALRFKIGRVRQNLRNEGWLKVNKKKEKYKASSLSISLFAVSTEVMHRKINEGDSRSRGRQIKKRKKLVWQIKYLEPSYINRYDSSFLNSFVWLFRRTISIFKKCNVLFNGLNIKSVVLVKHWQRQTMLFLCRSTTEFKDLLFKRKFKTYVWCYVKLYISTCTTTKFK